MLPYRTLTDHPRPRKNTAHTTLSANGTRRVGNSVQILIDPWLSAAIHDRAASTGQDYRTVCAEFETRGLELPVETLDLTELEDPWDALRARYRLSYWQQKEEAERVGYVLTADQHQRVHALLLRTFPRLRLPEVHRYLLAYGAAKYTCHGAF